MTKHDYIRLMSKTYGIISEDDGIDIVITSNTASDGWSYTVKTDSENEFIIFTPRNSTDIQDFQLCLDDRVVGSAPYNDFEPTLKLWNDYVTKLSNINKLIEKI